MAGGIGALYSNGVVVDNCINYGTIKVKGHSYSYGAAGGIVGAAPNCIIQNCINEGKVIDSYTRAGGILGRTYRSGTSTCNIYSCINKGETHAGILGGTVGEIINIINCCNLGKCTDGIMSSFSGADWTINMKMTIQNCYNGSVSNKAIVGNIKIHSSTITITNVTNTYYDTGKSENIGAVSEGITGLTESEMKNNETFIQTLNNNIGENTEWKRWKIGEDGYPTFE